MAAQRKIHDSDRYMPEPRGWTREQAAHYCGVSPSTFDLDWVPFLKPRLVGRGKTRKVYDRCQIDRVWDQISGLTNDDDMARQTRVAASYARMDALEHADLERKEKGRAR